VEGPSRDASKLLFELISEILRRNIRIVTVLKVYREGAKLIQLN
jgi:hypothetical protein